MGNPTLCETVGPNS